MQYIYKSPISSIKLETIIVRTGRLSPYLKIPCYFLFLKSDNSSWYTKKAAMKQQDLQLTTCMIKVGLMHKAHSSYCTDLLKKARYLISLDYS